MSKKGAGHAPYMVNTSATTESAGSLERCTGKEALHVKNMLKATLWAHDIA